MTDRRPVVVTGATGFIGRAVLRRLPALGRAAVLVTRPGREVAAREAAAAAGVEARAFAPGAGGADPAPEPVAAVLHLAGGRHPGSDAAALAANRADNVGSLRAIAPSLAAWAPDALVVAGSAESYGAARAPFVETDPPQPRSAYGTAKLEAEALAEELGRRHGVRVASARLAVVYGPGQPERSFLAQAVAALAARRPFAMSPGGQLRDFVHADDAADALLRLALDPRGGEGPVNVGSGGSVALRELAERLAAAFGATDCLRIGALPYRDDDIMDYRVSVERIAARLGWRASVALEAGLAGLVAART